MVPPAAPAGTLAPVVARCHATPSTHIDSPRMPSHVACSARPRSRSVRLPPAKRMRSASGRTASTNDTTARSSLSFRGIATRCAVAEPTVGSNVIGISRSTRRARATRPDTNKPRRGPASGPPAARLPSPPDSSRAIGGMSPAWLWRPGGASASHASPDQTADGRRAARSTTGPGPGAEGSTPADWTTIASNVARAGSIASMPTS